ncbi:MAG: glycine cleavage system aminomethyltransferase GcvT [Gammaproteobacteria bacterium]|nr:glycine cleavage system aminomethyltransferase GcvT [Gammaproteobacteria bacterium]HJO12488.1 glycine cleavage system aminomethyltransferase GcvT [Gammaproteobacteria bacterium]
MGQHTSLYQNHLHAGAKLVDFAGWEMPINYGSQIEEHNQVREHAGIFDVSHMTVVDIAGGEAEVYLRYLLANDVERLAEEGMALYSAMLNSDGGVIDDLIVYKMSFGYRLVVNCATREKDLAWLARHSASFKLAITERPDLAILAVHGPEAIAKVCATLSPRGADLVGNLGNFRGVEFDDWFVARTGYTGEKGLELIFPATQASACWDELLALGIQPVGLGARDTLRLEAGMNLYGNEMDETVSPIAANMAHTISWQPEDRNFIGREAVTAHKTAQEQGCLPELVGLALRQRGMLRGGQKVLTNKGEGVITSGGFSPTLKHSIALARIPVASQACQVDLRGTLTKVEIVKPNFVRFGKKVFD